MGPSVYVSNPAGAEDDTTPPDKKNAPRLLIVNGLAEDPTALARQLRGRGFEIVEASGSADALQRVDRQTFDMVLLEVETPEADRDPLTRLIGRPAFGRKLQETWKTAAAEGLKLCVLIVGLDGFKMVNDALGHAIGDGLLKEVAGRLSCLAGAQNIIARLGGDEFGFIHASNQPDAGAAALARRVIGAVAECRRIGEHEVFVTASAGVAVSHDGLKNPAALLKQAGLAMDRAKSSGGGNIRFFEPEMQRKSQRRRELEIDLRKAVSRYDFDLYYQPIVNLATRKVAGLEALMRWNHPERGFVPPEEFVAVAEDTGLITSMGEWALRRACQDAVGWPTDLRVAVNLSPRQLHEAGLVAVVVSALSASGLAPNRLELEITESAFLDRTAPTLAILKNLRDLGVRVSLDDFGAGYTGLGYLRDFKFDRLKVDQSFVRDMPRRYASAAIVRAALGLGASLGMTTIGEGVENDAELSWLVAEGCVEAQGYLFDAPQPRSKVLAAIEQLERRLSDRPNRSD